MRVFHGLHNIAGIPAAMARAERELGLHSVSACFPSGYINYETDVDEVCRFDTSMLVDRFERYADAFDVFVFHFGYSLAFDSLADIPVLKKMGKTVIFYFHGCDIRQSKETIQKYKFNSCAECWPQNCNRNRDHALKTALEYGDRIWVSTPDLLEFVPGAELFPQPVDLARFDSSGRKSSPSTPGKDRPFRIVHAPTNTQHKGTRYIKAAIEQLQKEGLPIELVLLEGLTHEALRAKLEEADFAIDQILTGSYGVFSVELMALGIPTICYLRDDLLGHYPEKPPLQIANPDTIVAVIRQMVGDSAQRAALADQGPRYVKKHHDAHKAVERSVSAYRAARAA